MGRRKKEGEKRGEKEGEKRGEKEEEGREGRRGKRGEKRKGRKQGQKKRREERRGEEVGGKKKHSLGVGACSNIATEVGVPHSHPHILTPSHCRQSTTCFSSMPPRVERLHWRCDEKKWLSSFVVPAAGRACGRTHLAVEIKARGEEGKDRGSEGWRGKR